MNLYNLNLIYIYILYSFSVWRFSIFIMNWASIEIYSFFFQIKISPIFFGNLNPINLFIWKPDISIESSYECHLNSFSEWCFSIIHSDLRICWSPGFKVGLAHIVLCISLIWGYNLSHIWTDPINSIIQTFLHIVTLYHLSLNL